MKAEDIKISGLYTMKVGKNSTAIRIMSQTKDGYWIGRNIKTDNDVIIKSANQLTGVYRIKRDKQTKVAKEKNEPSTDTTDKKERTTTKPGGLSCAVRVLQEEARPLNCQEMVKIMLEKGYWKTDGKTPAATVYSAIITEIKKKGENSRFRKTERGKFELAK